MFVIVEFFEKFNKFSSYNNQDKKGTEKGCIRRIIFFDTNKFP